MRVYIASSWKNQAAVELLTAALREKGDEVLSFVENNHGENASAKTDGTGRAVSFDEWVASGQGEQSFDYDLDGATETDLVVYIGPSGCDAWAEVGAAYASGVPIVGLWVKGEQSGLMRRMVAWSYSLNHLLESIAAIRSCCAAKELGLRLAGGQAVTP